MENVTAAEDFTNRNDEKSDVFVKTVKTSLSKSSLVRDQDRRSVKDAYDIYRAPASDRRSVQIIRPFSASSKNSYSAPVTLPIGPAYLAAVLENANYNVSILDSVGEDIYQITRSECGFYNVQGLSKAQIIARIDPDAAVVGLSLMFSQEWLLHRDLIKEIRKNYPELAIVVGGEHATSLPEYVLRDCPEIDFVITGEGELTFLNLVHNLFHDKPTNNVVGCSFLDDDGTYVSTDLSQRIEVIDELPRPAWHLCPVKNYFIDNWTMGVSKGRNMPILATRGCPYQCTFCSNPGMWTTRYKMRDVTQVVDEIEFLINEYDANSIDFFDLTAIVKKKWTLDFCAEIKRRGLKFIWQLPSGTRSEALDEETLAAIYEAGCEYLVYAPESGSKETLVAIKKKVNLESITESIQMAVKAGHIVKVNLIIGFPHERTKHVFETLRYAIQMAFAGAHDCNIAKFSPYPGSQLFDELRSDGVIPELSDKYFSSLVSQFDLTAKSKFCPNVPSLVLMLATTFGHGLFYILAYLGHPRRIWRVVRLVISRKFSPQNLFEQRIFDLLMRSKLVK